MKRTIEYCDELVNDKSRTYYEIVKQIQIDAIEATVLKCSQEAKIYVNYEHSLGGFHGITKQFKEKRRTNYKESLSINVKVNKDSILQVAEQLKKELE